MPKGKPNSAGTGAPGARDWTPTDTIVVAAAAGVGLVAALIARFGGLPRVQALVGLALIFVIAYVSSSARRAIDWRTIGWGLALQTQKVDAFRGACRPPVVDHLPDRSQTAP